MLLNFYLGTEITEGEKLKSWDNRLGFGEQNLLELISVAKNRSPHLCIKRTTEKRAYSRRSVFINFRGERRRRPNLTSGLSFVYASLKRV